MTILTLILSATLIVIAAIHLLWALGYWFPLRDEHALVRAAVGFRGAERMPGAIPCALVTVMLFAVTVVLWWPDGPIRQTLLIAAAVVFLARGVIAQAPFWRRMTPLEPFATYDKRYYGPLCLMIGVGILGLALG